MFTHLFKLIWNKKKQNALLITEMFISFIVMFAIFTVVVFCYKNYRQPMGFVYEDVWAVNYTPPDNITNTDSAVMFQDAIKNTLRSMPQITAFSFSSNNIPFSMYTSNSMVNYGKHKKTMANVYNAGEDYLKVLNIKMKSGRWITKADAMSKTHLVVINSRLEKELFDGQDAVGKKLGDDFPGVDEQNSQLQVIGVVEDIKDKGSYQEIESGMYRPIDTGWARWTGTMLLK
jgi:putative ABC transport system permease protein